MLRDCAEAVKETKAVSGAEVGGGGEEEEVEEELLLSLLLLFMLLKSERGFVGFCLWGRKFECERVSRRTDGKGVREV